MNSDNVRTIGESDKPETQQKKLWVKPSIEIILLESAAYGNHGGSFDSFGSSIRSRS